MSKTNIGNIKSLNRQITAMIMASIGVALIFTGILNACFLDDFYLFRKVTSVEDCYNFMYEAAKTGDIYKDESSNRIEKMFYNLGFSILIVSSDGTVLFSTNSDEDNMRDKLMSAIFSDDKVSSLIKETDNYTIIRQHDTTLNEEYMVLWGVLTDNNIVMLRTSLESIRVNTLISNKFLIYMGCLSLIVGFIMSIIIAKKVTGPIVLITDISKRITNLDFDKKFIPRDKRVKNEIDVLGENINVMSDTLESTIAELKKDIAILEDNENRRREFISNISHELKTPIALIQGYAEGLQEGVMDDEDSRNMYLEVIIDESRRMNRLVKELLTLNQLEREDDTVLENVDLNGLLKGVIDANTILFETNEIEVSHPDLSSELICLADEFLLEQVVNNYISNAIHYAKAVDEDNKKKIDIKQTIEDDIVRVSVFNTGDNISDKDIDQIWDKFYKADKARSREYGGSGIGLSVVKAVMEKFKQKYGVINHADGVEFFFELKINKQRI